MDRVFFRVKTLSWAKSLWRYHRNFVPVSKTPKNVNYFFLNVYLISSILVFTLAIEFMVFENLTGWADKWMFCLELWTLIENVFFIWQGPRGKPGPSGPPGPPGDRVSPQAQSCHALHCINTSRYLLSFCVLYICVFVYFLSGFHREARHGGTTGPSRHVCKWFFTAYTWCMCNPHYMDSILHQCPLTHSKLVKCTCLTADKKCWCCCILKISHMQHVWLVTASCVTISSRKC